MLDPRVTRLAELMCDHSLRLSSSDSLLIHAFDVTDEVVAEFTRVALSRGAKVATRLTSTLVHKELLNAMTPDLADLHANIELHEMKQMTAYLALRGGSNLFETSDTSAESRQLWQKHYAVPVVFGQRVPHTKWVVTRWPGPSMAQQASMSTAAFMDFYFRLTTVDYAKMAEACRPLKDLMDRTDRVHITGPGTDLRFSIKDIGAVACCGEANIPDGECFSCPVKESVEGVIQYNTASLYQGTEFRNIRYVVKQGKIVEATCEGRTDELNLILDTDPGARYFGEWSLGFNPQVLHPMLDTLFDEKIAGSMHLTPGNAYEPPGGNGNKSAVHWDTVLIQRPEYGGGELYFDDVLIRKDGLFVIPELTGLNPEALNAS